MSLNEFAGEKTFHKDVLDAVLEASKKVDTKLVDGKEVQVISNDYESIYWITRNVNSTNFSRFVLKLKELESLGDQAINCMMPERARIIQEGIQAIVKNYKYSIDSKASESVLDNNNKQSTFVDKLTNYKIEKKYTTNEKMKQGFLKGIIGKDKEDDEDR